MKPIYRNLIMLLAIALVPAAESISHAWQSGSQGSGTRQGSTTRQGSGSRQGSGTQKAAQNEQPQELSEEAKAFLELQKQIRANQNQIDHRLRTLPIGFPERRKAFNAEIKRLTAANEALKKEVFSKAKAAFKSSDNPSFQSTTIIEKKLKSMLIPRGPDDTFDPFAALELIALMREKFPKEAKYLDYEFRANYAVERFENAKQAVRRLEKLKGADLGFLKKELNNTMEKYQQELMIRRLEANTDDLPRVLLVTSEGDITIELFENHAPNTVANFIHLVRDQKFYDGKLFHLVKPGEFAVTGSPTGNGMGNAGYRIPCECYDKDVIRSHFRGTVTMMTQKRDGGGSQFFITQQPNPHSWDGQYTAFGRVIEGMDVVLKLQIVDKTSSMASTTGVSKIIRAEVIRARSHTYMPKKIASSTTGIPGIDSPSMTGSGSRDDATSDEDNGDVTGSFDLLLPKKSGGK